MSYNDSKYAKEARKVWDQVFQVPFFEIAGGDKTVLKEIYENAKLTDWRYAESSQETQKVETNLNNLLRSLGLQRVITPEEKEKDKRDVAEITQKEKQLTERGLKPAEIEAWRKERIGQTRFRKDVIALCHNKCIVTEVDCEDVLIASHIRGWAECDNDDERLDGENGLLLAPHIDKLFDKHLISFDDDGKILVKGKGIEKTLKTWGIDIDKKYGEFSEKKKQYLQYHREKFGVLLFTPVPQVTVKSQGVLPPYENPAPTNRYLLRPLTGALPPLPRHCPKLFFRQRGQGHTARGA
jgi:predicted restriction endonuclease